MTEHVSLNGMQQMMLRWEEFRPVNAAHLVVLQDRITLESLKRAVQAATRTLSLGPVEICSRRTTIRWHDGSSAARDFPVPTILEACSWEQLYSGVASELNTRFVGDVHWPFRLSFVPDVSGQSAILLTYQHAVTDSRGASIILREILRELRRNGEPEHSGETTTWRSPEVPSLQSKRSLPGRIADSITEAIQGSRQVRRRQCSITSARIVCPVPHARLRLDAVKQTARAYGVRIQPLFLAAIFEGLSVLLQDEIGAGRWRREIRIQTPVDLRSEHAASASDPRIQFLGCTAHSIRGTQKRSFADILASLKKESQSLRDPSHAARCLGRMETMARVWDSVPRSWNRAISPALFSAAALSSNVNLGEFFSEEVRAGQIASCLRFTGTGILIPLMIGLTTVGDEMFLTMTSHEGAFTTAELQLLMDHLVSRMTDVQRLPATEGRTLPSRDGNAIHSLQTAGV